MVREGLVQCRVSGRQVLQRYLDELATAGVVVLPDSHRVSYGIIAVAEDRRPRWRTYLLLRASAVTGADVVRAVPTRERGSGTPAVQLTFSDRAAAAPRALTAEDVGRRLAVVVDDEVPSAVAIERAFAGNLLTFTVAYGPPEVQEREAHELAEVLRAGPLPAPLRLESLSEVRAGPPPSR